MHSGVLKLCICDAYVVKNKSANGLHRNSCHFSLKVLLLKVTEGLGTHAKCFIMRGLKLQKKRQATIGKSIGNAVEEIPMSNSFIKRKAHPNWHPGTFAAQDVTESSDEGFGRKGVRIHACKLSAMPAFSSGEPKQINHRLFLFYPGGAAAINPCCCCCSKKNKPQGWKWRFLHVMNVDLSDASCAMMMLVQCDIEKESMIKVPEYFYEKVWQWVIKELEAAKDTV